MSQKEEEQTEVSEIASEEDIIAEEETDEKLKTKKEEMTEELVDCKDGPCLERVIKEMLYNQ